MLVRHSRRTTKCKRCGERRFYWYHDTNRPGERVCSGNDDCTEAGKGTSWVLLDANSGLRHTRKCVEFVYEPAEDETGPVAAKATAAEVEAIPDYVKDTPPVGNGQSDDPKLAALQALLAGPDEATIKGWAQDAIKDSESALVDLITEKVDKLAVPTVVTVKGPDGDERELPEVAHKVLPDVVTVLDAGLHPWLVGPAGTGKSTIGHQAADALGIPFYAISLSPNTPMSELVGYQDANGNYVGTVFRQAYEHGGLMLFDEIDNGHPSSLAKVNMALSNGMMAFPDGMVQRHPDFRAVAAANTFGTGPDRAYVGRMQLDAATLDRFVTIEVPTDEALETALARAQGASDDDTIRLLSFVRHCRRNTEAAKLPIVFSARASIDGCRLLAAGLSWDTVVAMRVRKGTSDADWSKVSKGWTRDSTRGSSA